MDTTTFIEKSLNEVHERLVKSLKGLSQNILVWRPAPHANCIAEIVFHLARAEDRMVRSMAKLGPEIWASQKWYERFRYPKEQSRRNDFRMIMDLGLPAPKLEDLLAYIEALHEDTLEKLHALSADDLDRAPDPSRPEYTLALFFRHLIVHSNNHHGQIDFIRGLSDANWDLPPGTGIVQK